MNSVHEQGPNGDSETPPSRKTRSKTKPVARAPNWPSQRTRRAHAWPCRGQPNDVLWPRPWPCRRRKAPYRGRCQRRVVGAGAVSQCAVLRARLPCPGLSRDTTLPQALLLWPPITIHLGVLRYKAPSPTNLPVTIQSSVL